MDDVSDDAKAGVYRRVEVLTGPVRRRRWSDDDKARIVAEAARPGVVVSEIARRWQVTPQQVFDWRRQAHRALVGNEAASAPTIYCPEPPSLFEKSTTPKLARALVGTGFKGGTGSMRPGSKGMSAADTSPGGATVEGGAC